MLAVNYSEVESLIDCQSASNFDSSSDSNFAPFERRVLTVTLDSSEPTRVAETSAGDVIVVAAFESPTAVVGLDG